jgi:hypothetical protein
MNVRFAWFVFPVGLFAACSGSGSESPAASGATRGAGGEAAGGSGGAEVGGAGGAAPADAGADGDGSDGSHFDCDVVGVPGYCLDVADCAAMPDHASTAGFCPGAANIQCCTPFGKALCDPAVVPEPNAGNTIEAPGEGGCPDGMLPVATFCVDKYEASLVRADDGSAWSPFFNPGTTPVRAVSVAGAVPQGYIDGVQAGEACTNAGKRLCTDAEWLRACQGPTKTTYPYGNTDELGVCNDHRAVHPAIEYFGTSASWIWSEIDNPCIDQLPETVDLTGSLPGCVTAEGAFDMMGNLHEWTADPAGTFRGGYYVDTVLNGPGCLYATTAHNTLHWDYSTGFRCCAD